MVDDDVNDDGNDGQEVRGEVTSMLPWRRREMLQAGSRDQVFVIYHSHHNHDHHDDDHHHDHHDHHHPHYDDDQGCEVEQQVN